MYIVKTKTSKTIYEFEKESEAKDKAKDLSKTGKEVQIFKLDCILKLPEPIFEKVSPRDK